MGGVLDCSADPLEGEIDLSKLDGPILKPFHAMSIKELAYNVEFSKNQDSINFGGGGRKKLGRQAVEKHGDGEDDDDDEEPSASLSVLEPPTSTTTTSSTE
jgi:hypothetical protein